MKKHKHNTVKVVLVTLLLFMLLSWILPAAYFSTEYVDQGRVQMGLFDLFNYPLTSLSYFGYIALFVIVVGGFYGILYKIPAYRSFLDKIVKAVNGNEFVAISIIMILLAIITSFCGMQLALVVFFPLLVTLILLMGYDKIVAALVLVGSTMIGVAGTTFGISNTNLLISTLSLKTDSQVIVKIVILFVGLILLILNTYFYIKKLKITKVNTTKNENKKVEKIVAEENSDVEVSSTANTKTKSSANKSTKTKASSKSTKNSKSSSKSSKKDLKAAVKDDDVIVVSDVDDDSLGGFIPVKTNEKHSTWLFTLSFILLFVLMILAFIPWNDVFKVTAFNDATTAISEFKLFGFPLFGKLLGNVNAFGTWAITDLFFILAVIVFLLVFIYRVKLDDVFDGFANGAKKAFGPAIITILVYTCLVAVTYHPYQLVIYKAILGITKGFNVFTTSVVALIASLFNADPSYSFQSVLPYFVSVVKDHQDIVAVIFQAMYGLTMLVAPTSLILMGTLSYLDVSYKNWWKAIWKLFVELLVILLIVFTILAVV